MKMFSFFAGTLEPGVKRRDDDFIEQKPQAEGLGWVNSHTMADGRLHEMIPSPNFQIPSIPEQSILDMKGKKKGELMIGMPAVDVNTFKPTMVGGQDMIPISKKKLKKDDLFGLDFNSDSKKKKYKEPKIGEIKFGNFRSKRKDPFLISPNNFGLGSRGGMSLTPMKIEKPPGLGVPKVGDITFGNARKKKKKKPTTKPYSKKAANLPFKPMTKQEFERLRKEQAYRLKREELSRKRVGELEETEKDYDAMEWALANQIDELKERKTETTNQIRKDEFDEEILELERELSDVKKNKVRNKLEKFGEKASQRFSKAQRGALRVKEGVRKQFPKGIKIVPAKEVSVKKTAGHVFGGGTKEQKRRRNLIFGEQTLISQRGSSMDYGPSSLSVREVYGSRMMPEPIKDKDSYLKPKRPRI